jgi:hypothetical protein
MDDDAVSPGILASAVSRPVLPAVFVVACLLPGSTARAQDPPLGSQSTEQLRNDREQIDALLTSIDGGGTYIVDPRMGLDPDPQAGESVLVLPVATDDLEKTLLAMLIESESPGDYDDYLQEVERRTRSVRSALLAWRSRYDDELARRGDRGQMADASDDEEYVDGLPPCGHTMEEGGNTMETSPGSRVYVECRPSDHPVSTNPTTQIPASRERDEPPPVDWDVPAVSKEERCARTRQRIEQNRMEEARLEREIAEGEARLEAIDGIAWREMESVRSALTLASQAPFVEAPPELASLLEQGSVAKLDNVLASASSACLQGMVDALEPKWAWACPVLAGFPALSASVGNRLDRRQSISLDVIDANQRKLRSLIPQIQADERSLILLECP